MIRVLLTALLAGILCQLAYAQQTWELAKRKTPADGDITIYTRAVPGMKLKEYKGVALVAANVSTLLAVFMDHAGYPLLFPNCINPKTLAHNGEKGWMVYIENATPWPIRHRDVVVRTTVSQEADGTLCLTLLNVDGIEPVHEGIIRGVSYSGVWRFKPLGPGRTEVTCTGLADPGGSLPNWLVNMFIIDDPLQSLENLRTRVKLAQYQGKKLLVWKDN